MALDAAPIAFGKLVFDDRAEEACGWSAFLVRLLGELRPHHLDGGQTQFVEEQAEPCGVEACPE